MTFTDTIGIDATSGASEGCLYVDPAAEYLRDHFPGMPVLPGLVMLEAAVRTAAALWCARTPQVSVVGALLEHVERLQVVRRVVPGETLVVRTQMVPGEERATTATFTARGVVAGETVLRARFRLRALWSRDKAVNDVRGDQHDAG